MSFGKEGIGNENSQVVKNVYVVSAADKSTHSRWIFTNCRFSERRSVMRVTFNRKKHSQWNVILQIILKISLKLLLQKGRSWPLFFFF
jgi:hypothetical protein